MNYCDEHAKRPTSALNLTIGKAFEIANDRSVTLDFVDTYFGIYVDLLTLQERIAGRSPAFEGIRLVKERIR